MKEYIYLRFIEMEDGELVLLNPEQYGIKDFLDEKLDNKNGKWVTTLSSAGIKGLDLISAFSHRDRVNYIFKAEDGYLIIE